MSTNCEMACHVCIEERLASCAALSVSTPAACSLPGVWPAMSYLDLRAVVCNPPDVVFPLVCHVVHVCWHAARVSGLLACHVSFFSGAISDVMPRCPAYMACHGLLDAVRCGHLLASPVPLPSGLSAQDGLPCLVEGGASLGERLAACTTTGVLCPLVRDATWVLPTLRGCMVERAGHQGGVVHYSITTVSKERGSGQGQGYGTSSRSSSPGGPTNIGT